MLHNSFGINAFPKLSFLVKKRLPIYNKSMKNTRKNRITAELDSAIYNDSLWKRLEGKKLEPEQLDFLSFCMEQNLEHARHVENERLTFNTIYLALVAAGLAVAESLDSRLRFALFAFLTFMGALSMLLTARWNNAFSRHLYYAQQCYKTIHLSLFGEPEDKSVVNNTTVESIGGLMDTPAYAFRIRQPIAHTEFGSKFYKIRTSKLYITFYWMVELVLILGMFFSFFQWIGII